MIDYTHLPWWSVIQCFSLHLSVGMKSCLIGVFIPAPIVNFYSEDKHFYTFGDKSSGHCLVFTFSVFIQTTFEIFLVFFLWPNFPNDKWSDLPCPLRKRFPLNSLFGPQPPTVKPPRFSFYLQTSRKLYPFSPSGVRLKATGIPAWLLRVNSAL